MLEVEIQAIVLILVAVGVYLLARRIRTPYTTALVLTGMAISLLGTSTLHELFSIELDSDLIMFIFLPGLIFDAGYNFNTRQLREVWKPILALAVPGLLISTGIIGSVLHVLLGLSFPVALLFGGLISATDPISVLALFKELGVTHRLTTLMEGESLLNDGTAVVIFTLLLGVAVRGEDLGFAEGFSQFVIVMVGGVMIGLVTSIAVSYAFEHVEDHVIQIALTIVLAYGTFIIAEELHLSPVIAVAVAGITLDTRQRGANHTTPGAQISITDFWELITFLINSAIFLLLGLQVRLFGESGEGPSLANELGPILVVIGVVLAARFIVVKAACMLSAYYDENRIPPKWDLVIFWGGLRGSVSMALALSLPVFADRERLLVWAFGYVAFSLIVAGLTMKPLLRRLGITQRSAAEKQWESLLAELRMIATTRRTFEHLSDDNLLPPTMEATFRQAADRALDERWARIEGVMSENPALLQERTRYILGEITRDRRAALLDLEQRGHITEDTYKLEVEKLMLEIEGVQEVEASEQVYESLMDLAGPQPQATGLRQLFRQSPELAQSMARIRLSQAARDTIQNLLQTYPVLSTFLSQDFNEFLAYFEDDSVRQTTEMVSLSPELQAQIARIALFELVSSQRTEFSRMLRQGILAGEQYAQLNKVLDDVITFAEESQDVHQINAAMLTITALIRGLQPSEEEESADRDNETPE